MSTLEIIDERVVLEKEFRIYGTIDDPLFLAKDVANWIEHSDARKMIQNIDEDEKLMGTMFHSGQNREMWFLTEDGLYEVLMQSRKPIAKQFKKEVKKILKSIRKDGIYMTDKKAYDLSTNPDSIVDLLERAAQQIRDKEVIIQRMEPKEIFADAVAESTSTILIGELAKILKQNGVPVGQNRLFQILRAEGYLISRRGTDYNMPTQKAMELGLFRIKEKTIELPDGSTKTVKTTTVTGYGQQYFTNKFLKSKFQTA